MTLDYELMLCLFSEFHLHNIVSVPPSQQDFISTMIHDDRNSIVELPPICDTKIYFKFIGAANIDVVHGRINLA